MRRAVAKAVSEGLSNPITLNELVSAGVANVSLDEHLDAGDLLAIGDAFSEYDSDDLKGYSIPSEPMNDLGRRAGAAPAHGQGADDAQRLPRAAARHPRPGEHRRHRAQRHRASPARRPTRPAPSASIGFNVVDVDSYPTEDVGRTTVLLRLLRRARPPGGWPPTSPAAPRSSSDDDLGLRGGDRGDRQRLHDHPRPAGAQGLARRPAHHDVHHRAHRARRRPARRPPPPRVPTTTTTVIGYSTGEPPDGVDC